MSPEEYIQKANRALESPTKTFFAGSLLNLNCIALEPVAGSHEGSQAKAKVAEPAPVEAAPAKKPRAKMGVVALS